MTAEIYPGEARDLADALEVMRHDLAQVKGAEDALVRHIEAALVSGDVVRLRAAYDAVEELPDEDKVAILRAETERQDEG